MTRWLNCFRRASFDLGILILLFSPCICGFTDSLNVHTQVLQVRDDVPFLGSNFYNLAYHASIVVNDTLYIDGGEVAWQSNGVASGRVPMNYTLAISLSQSWAPENATFQAFSKDNGVPTLDYQSLWAAPDNQSFYAFGGTPSLAVTLKPTNPPNGLWQFSQGSWSSVASNGNSFPSITRPASGSGASGNGAGYLLGGFDSIRNWEWSPQGYTPVPGLVSYDMESNSWTNVSAMSFSFGGTAINGAMQYMPNFGSEGLLLAMGGETPGSGGWLNLGADLLSFSNISVFDPATGDWYWQSTTGFTGSEDIPGGASMFCHTGAKSSDSTYEIFVYGGHNDSLINGNHVPTPSEAEAQKQYNQVYVLSLPGFVWFKANDTSGPAKYGHTCENFGNGQMISIGGIDPSDNFFQTANITDPFPQGLGIFDMVNFSWVSSYDANAGPYEAPNVVKEWYSRPNSNSSVDWVFPRLKSLFLNSTSGCSQGSGACPSATGGPFPNETGTLGSGSDSSPSISNANQNTLIAPLVGGVFGGLAFISLVSGLAAWFFLRRRRICERQELETPAQLPDAYPVPPPKDFEVYSEHSPKQEVSPVKPQSMVQTEESDMVSPLTATTMDYPHFRSELSSGTNPAELDGESRSNKWLNRVKPSSKASSSASGLSPISERDAQ